MAKSKEIMQLPVFFLYRRVVFPYCPLEIKTLNPLPGGLQEGADVVVLPIRNMFGMIFQWRRTGILSRVVSFHRQNDHYTVKFQGIRRVKILRVKLFEIAEFCELPEESESALWPVLESLRKKAQELIFLINTDTSDRLIQLLEYIPNLSQLTDFIANYFVLDFPRRFKLLRTYDIKKRAELLFAILVDIIANYKKKKGILE